MEANRPLDRPVLAWLASEANAGREHALRELLIRLRAPLLRFLARTLSDPEDVKDAWQDTALAVSTGLRRLGDTTMVRAWAFRIAHNKAMDVHRRRARERRTDAELPPAPAVDLDRALLLRQLIDRLRPDDRAIITWFYGDELSLGEIAHALGISPATARVRLFRARNRLKQLTKGEET